MYSSLFLETQSKEQLRMDDQSPWGSSPRQSNVDPTAQHHMSEGIDFRSSAGFDRAQMSQMNYSLSNQNQILDPVGSDSLIHDDKISQSQKFYSQQYNQLPNNGKDQQYQRPDQPEADAQLQYWDPPQPQGSNLSMQTYGREYNRTGQNQIGHEPMQNEYAQQHQTGEYYQAQNDQLQYHQQQFFQQQQGNHYRYDEQNHLQPPNGYFPDNQTLTNAEKFDETFNGQSRNVQLQYEQSQYDQSQYGSNISSQTPDNGLLRGQPPPGQLEYANPQLNQPIQGQTYLAGATQIQENNDSPVGANNDFNGQVGSLPEEDRSMARNAEDHFQDIQAEKAIEGNAASNITSNRTWGANKNPAVSVEARARWAILRSLAGVFNGNEESAEYVDGGDQAGVAPQSEKMSVNIKQVESQKKYAQTKDPRTDPSEATTERTDAAGVQGFLHSLGQDPYADARGFEAVKLPQSLAVGASKIMQQGDAKAKDDIGNLKGGNERAFSHNMAKYNLDNATRVIAERAQGLEDVVQGRKPDVRTNTEVDLRGVLSRLELKKDLAEGKPILGSLAKTLEEGIPSRQRTETERANASLPHVGEDVESAIAKLELGKSLRDGERVAVSVVGDTEKGVEERVQSVEEELRKGEQRVRSGFEVLANKLEHELERDAIPRVADMKEDLCEGVSKVQNLLDEAQTVRIRADLGRDGHCIERATSKTVKEADSLVPAPTRSSRNGDTRAHPASTRPRAFLDANVPNQHHQAALRSGQNGAIRPQKDVEPQPMPNSESLKQKVADDTQHWPRTTQTPRVPPSSSPKPLERAPITQQSEAPSDHHLPRPPQVVHDRAPKHSDSTGAPLRDPMNLAHAPISKARSSNAYQAHEPKRGNALGQPSPENASSHNENPSPARAIGGWAKRDQASQNVSSLQSHDKNNARNAQALKKKGTNPQCGLPHCESYQHCQLQNHPSRNSHGQRGGSIEPKCGHPQCMLHQHCQKHADRVRACDASDRPCDHPQCTSYQSCQLQAHNVEQESTRNAKPDCTHPQCELQKHCQFAKDATAQRHSQVEGHCQPHRHRPSAQTDGEMAYVDTTFDEAPTHELAEIAKPNSKPSSFQASPNISGLDVRVSAWPIPQLNSQQAQNNVKRSGQVPKQIPAGALAMKGHLQCTDFSTIQRHDEPLVNPNRENQIPVLRTVNVENAAQGIASVPTRTDGQLFSKWNNNSGDYRKLNSQISISEELQGIHTEQSDIELSRVATMHGMINTFESSSQKTTIAVGGYPSFMDQMIQLLCKMARDALPEFEKELNQDKA